MNASARREAGSVVLGLAALAASAWARGDEALAERLFAGAVAVVDGAEFVDHEAPDRPEQRR